MQEAEPHASEMHFSRILLLYPSGGAQRGPVLFPFPYLGCYGWHPRFLSPSDLLRGSCDGEQNGFGLRLDWHLQKKGLASLGTEVGLGSRT